MRYKIENFEDISDAKSFMNAYKSSCSYNFLKYVMYIIVVTFISVIVWSIFAEKDIVVDAVGEIDMNNKVCNIYIENTNIGNIKEGKDVQLEIISLPRNEYGVIKSEINNVSDEIVVTDESNSKKYYMAACNLEEVTLKNKSGDDVKLKTGMQAKVSIINYKTTYFDYILRKITS